MRKRLWLCGSGCSTTLCLCRLHIGLGVARAWTCAELPHGCSWIAPLHTRVFLQDGMFAFVWLPVVCFLPPRPCACVLLYQLHLWRNSALGGGGLMVSACVCESDVWQEGMFVRAGACWDVADCGHSPPPFLQILCETHWPRCCGHTAARQRPSKTATARRYDVDGGRGCAVLWCFTTHRSELDHLLSTWPAHHHSNEGGGWRGGIVFAHSCGKPSRHFQTNHAWRLALAVLVVPRAGPTVLHLQAGGRTVPHCAHAGHGWLGCCCTASQGQVWGDGGYNWADLC
jgi:hypothetical protein